MKAFVPVTVIQTLLFTFSVYSTENFPNSLSLCELNLTDQSPFSAVLRGDAARAFMFHVDPELEADRKAAIQAMLAGARDVATPVFNVSFDLDDGGFKEQLAIHARITEPVSQDSQLTWEMDLSRLTYHEFAWLIEKNKVRERIRNGRYQDRGALQALLMRTGLATEKPLRLPSLSEIKMMTGPFIYMEPPGKHLDGVFDNFIKRFKGEMKLVEGDGRIPPLPFKLEMASIHMKDGSTSDRAIMSYCEDGACQKLQPVILERRSLEPTAIQDNYYVSQNIEPGYTIYALDLTHASFMSLVVLERNFETMGYPEDDPLRARLKYFRTTYIDSLKQKKQH